MGMFKKKGVGILDIIRCDEPNYLIWKWHPTGTRLGEAKREFAIRWGSALRVKDGEVAVFVYRQKDGKMQDFIVGPFDQKLKTANLPILSGIIGLAYKGDTPFQAEVYFINLAKIIQVKFAVPYFDVFDPRFSDFGVPVAVRGTISFKIENYQEFIKLHRLSHFDLNEFRQQIGDAVSRYVKDAVANAPAAHDIPVVQIESRTAMINDDVELNLRYRLQEDFGVCASGIDIGAIEIDKSSEGYAALMAVTQNVIKAKTAANVEHYTENLRIQREETQYARRMAAQSANLSAFQVEKQAEVGIAGAEALGKMGENGAGGVDLGGTNGTGFNPAAMMASMAVGSAVGQNIAGTVSGAMAGVSAGATPPPLPGVAYYVATDGQAMGPYDMATIKQLVVAGQFTAETLVWKNGMSDWARAETVAELKALCNAMPPFPPTV